MKVEFKWIGSEDPRLAEWALENDLPVTANDRYLFLVCDDELLDWFPEGEGTSVEALERAFRLGVAYADGEILCAMS